MTSGLQSRSREALGSTMRSASRREPPAVGIRADTLLTRRVRRNTIGPVEPYPRWRYFPSYVAPPSWVPDIVAVFAVARASIDSMVEHEKRRESDDVLAIVAPALVELGFVVESGKTKSGKLPRPVSFGDEGTVLRTYEIDAFQAEHGIALEVEAGRATMGNNIYRDLVQGSLMVDAKFLVVAVPVEYRYGERPTREPSYAKCYSLVDAIYGSPRLNLPFEGLLLIGY